MYYICFFVNFILFNLLFINIVNCAPYPPQRSGRFYGGGGSSALDSASEYSSSVQKTYQQDINVKKPALNSWGLGYLGSNHIFPQQSTVISSVPIAVQSRRIPIVERPLVGVALQSGGFGAGHQGLPDEEESLHIYKEESQNLSKTPLIGQGVGIMQSDNSEKIFRKSHVSKPVITGGII